MLVKFDPSVSTLYIVSDPVPYRVLPDNTTPVVGITSSPPPNDPNACTTPKTCASELAAPRKNADIPTTACLRIVFIGSSDCGLARNRLILSKRSPGLQEKTG